MREDDSSVVVPLLSEEACVERQRVITGRVRVSRVSRQHEEILDALLTHESVEIERTSLDQVVERIPPVREEGDTIIIPVVEEVLVIQRRLVLKEEVRVRRVRTQEKYRGRVQLRRQEVLITRDADADKEFARKPEQQNS